MSEPARPAPPILGKATHHTVELYWDEALVNAAKNCKSRMKVSLQEEEKNGGWGTVYTGYSKRHIQDGLEPWTQYKYRVRFMNDHGNSEWSPSIIVSTTKEPISGDHLHRAIYMDSLSQLETVLNSGEGRDHIKNIIDTPDKYGFSPLMSAAKKGNRQMLEMLIEYGADVNFQNEAGKSPLMLAAYAGQRDACECLIDADGKLDLKDRGGSTALHWSMDSGNPALIDFLLNRGADIASTDCNGWTPLLRTAAVGGNDEAARKLILHNKEMLNTRDKDGKTALMIAVINGHQKLVELLLKHGADLTVKNEYGKSAYEMALSLERRRVIKTLEDFMDEKGMKRHF